MKTSELIEEFTEKLVGVDETKQAIKTAIESKGQDLTGVPFTEFAEKIMAISGGGGRKTTTGTVTFASNEGIPIITHNLGVVPSTFFMIAKNVQGEFTFNTENSPAAGIYGFFVDMHMNLPTTMFKGENIEDESWKGLSLEWRNNNATKLLWQTNGSFNNNLKSPTETEIQLSYRSNVYRYLAGVEYEWIAIE